MTADRCRFHAAVWNYIRSQKVVPEATELAEWMAAQAWADPPPDLSLMLGRLRAWPHGKPYPPLPDDDALAGGTFDIRWWWPGSVLGVTGFSEWLPKAVTVRPEGQTSFAEELSVPEQGSELLSVQPEEVSA